VAVLLVLAVANSGFTANEPAGDTPSLFATAPPPAPVTTWPTAPLGHYRTSAEREIDPTTLYGKLVVGYQGWFSTVGVAGQSAGARLEPNAARTESDDPAHETRSSGSPSEHPGQRNGAFHFME